MMELFQHRYYRLGKMLMCLIGQWPDQSTSAGRGILTFFFLFIAYMLLAVILAVVKYWGDWDVLLESLVPITCIAVYVTKYLGFAWNPQKTKKLLNRICTDWQIWAQDREVKFLHEYAQWGEKITVVYTAMLYICTFTTMMQPMIRKLINDVLKNDTTPGRFLYPVSYYHIDEQKYFVHLFVYWIICTCMLLTILISSDVMLILYVQHACGVFTALGHKLERIGSQDNQVEAGETPYELSKTDMIHLASLIVRHNDAIEFADLITTSYAWNFFITIGLGMIVCNAAGLQMLLRRSDLGTVSIFAAVILAALCYFYVECYISQILMDHSISIRFYILNSQWYRLPPNAQKFLQLMTIRCNLPCQLTAGNMLTMSVETFVKALRTFLSFLTCIRSVQAL